MDESKEVSQVFLSLSKSHKILNIYKPQMAGLGAYSNSMTVLTRDTVRSVYEIDLGSGDVSKKKVYDEMGIRTSEGIDSIRKVVSYIENDFLSGIMSYNNDNVVLSFSDCCPRLRVVFVKDPIAFFKRYYGEDFNLLINNDKNDKGPWIRKLGDDVFEFLIKDDI